MWVTYKHAAVRFLLCCCQGYVRLRNSHSAWVIFHNGQKLRRTASHSSTHVFISKSKAREMLRTFSPGFYSGAFSAAVWGFRAFCCRTLSAVSHASVLHADPDYPLMKYQYQRLTPSTPFQPPPAAMETSGRLGKGHGPYVTQHAQMHRFLISSAHANEYWEPPRVNMDPSRHQLNGIKKSMGN